MLLWNFRDKNKGDAPKRPEGETPRHSLGSVTPKTKSLTASPKKAARNSSPRPVVPIPSPKPKASSMRLPPGRQLGDGAGGGVVYATDDFGTTYIKAAKFDSILEYVFFFF